MELGGGREGAAGVVLVSAVEKSRLSVHLWTRRGGGGHGGGAGDGGAWTEVHAQFAVAEGGRGFECAAHGDYVVHGVRAPPGDVGNWPPRPRRHGWSTAWMV